MLHVYARYPVTVFRLERLAFVRWQIAVHLIRALIVCCGLSVWASGQRTAPTALRRATLQVGGGFSSAKPDYSQGSFRGGSVYATLDMSPHIGVEFMFHQVNTRAFDAISERTYELGPRYVWHLRRVEPFVKVSYGRGVFNYPNSVANLAYNMITLMGGVDVKVQRHIYVRGEYEYQRWWDFPSNGLTPQITTLGAAYRF